jgi:3-phosphoshikimate 1-carboxyvinyltransferase
MATAGAIVGLAVPGVEVDDIGCTSKTLPEFDSMWSAMIAGAPGFGAPGIGEVPR